MRTAFLAIALFGLSGLALVTYLNGEPKIALASALLVGVNYLFYTA